MINNKYENIDPDIYHKRYWEIPREIYLRLHWTPIIYNLISKYCKRKKVLDLGCGYGRYFGIIKKFAKEVIGLDSCKRWLKYAKKKYPEDKFILANAENIPLREQFDVIVCIGLLEYVNRVKVMKEIDRLLKNGGYLLIAVPNKYSFDRFPRRIYNLIFGGKDNLNEPSKKEMIDIMSNNFKILKIIMDDGLIYLPDWLDKKIGLLVYFAIERIFSIFGFNPFSSGMVFLGQKVK